jgi:hypothetical protein
LWNRIARENVTRDGKASATNSQLERFQAD